MEVVTKGSHVIYTDPRGNDRPALITNLFGSGSLNPSANVVFVNDDDNQTDSYGNKIERATSCPHQTMQYAHGNCWRRVAEERQIAEPK